VGLLNCFLAAFPKGDKMNVARKLSAILLLVLLCLYFGQAFAAPKDANDQEQTEEDATKGSKDVDEAVQYPMDAVQRAVKIGMQTYGFDIKKDKADYLEGTRSRHVGVVVGSGGEKVTVQLSPESGGTRVKIETGKGFVGRLGKKNWSTPIFNEALKALKGA
jgi:hypothetical protein